NEIARYYIEEDRNQRYAIYDPPSEYLFGAAVYFKGAWVLHMLRKQILGDSLFSEVMHQYREQFGGGTVSTEDFIQVVNDVYPGEDLHWFFDQWVYLAGHPDLEIGVFPDLEGHMIQVFVLQHQSNAPFFRFPITIEYGIEDYSELDTVWVEPYPAWADAISGDWPLARLAPFQPLLYVGTGASAPPTPVETPSEFALGSAYPNPFNSSITIPFELAHASRIKADLFDVSGRLVAKLYDKPYEAGGHTIHYDASPTLSSGVYVLRVKADEQFRYAKLLLLK
ncbi:T9SS type A sorting domain-containing protein, partial [bacterium]|nr:T9SS type A sorting domain-containing protein [bacterium]